MDRVLHYGVKETSEHAIASARRMLALLDEDRNKIEAPGRSAASVLRVFHYAQTHPILSIAPAAEKIESTFPTVAAAIEYLQRLGILHEITGRRRHRRFADRSYMNILNKGTEPLR